MKITRIAFVRPVPYPGHSISGGSCSWDNLGGRSASVEPQGLRLASEGSREVCMVPWASILFVAGEGALEAPTRKEPESVEPPATQKRGRKKANQKRA